MEESEARELVVGMGLRLLREGLVAGTWGNASLRFETELMAITPTGTDYRAMRPEDVVVVELETGRARRGTPSSEKSLHLAIYRERPEARAIVHTHSASVSTLAAARRELPPVLDDLAQLCGPSVRVADYAPPGSERMAWAALAALRGRMACLLANHGAVALGRSAEEAILCAMVLEKGARSYIEATILGGARAVGGPEARALHEAYLEHYSRHRLEGER